MYMAGAPMALPAASPTQRPVPPRPLSYIGKNCIKDLYIYIYII